MFIFWFSVVLVIGANVAYHVCQKVIPVGANPFVSLFVTFMTAAAATLIVIPFGLGDSSLLAEFRKLNWASAAIGLTIVGVDLGYLLVYRSGWNVSLGSAFCNAWVALLLIPVGVALFKERLITSNYVGVVLALVGVFLITRR
jgi:hypothetical protein